MPGLLELNPDRQFVQARLDLVQQFLLLDNQPNRKWIHGSPICLYLPRTAGVGGMAPA